MIALAATLASAPSLAADAGQLTMEIAAPAGYEALAAEDVTVADVYFGGVAKGKARIRYSPGKVAFEDLPGLVALLPGLRPEAVARVAEALRGDLAANAGKACHPLAGPGCGELEPDVAAVIFEESRFRVYVFVNPELLAVSGLEREARHIPAPTSDGLTFFNPIDVFVSTGREDGGWDDELTVNSRSFLSKGPYSLKVESSYYSDPVKLNEQRVQSAGFSLDNASALYVRPGWLYEAGFLRTVSVDLLGTEQILGASVTTTTETRIDLAQARGTSLVVFLPTRSTVDLLVDGRLVSRRSYPSGNQSLDTAGLPDGGYNVTIRVRDATGLVTEETRFFARSSRVPPKDQPTFIVQAGMLVKDRRTSLPRVTDTPVARVGSAYRLAGALAASADVIGNDRMAVATLGADYLGGFGIVTATALVATNGSFGGSLTAYGHLGGRFSYSVSGQFLDRAGTYDPATDALDDQQLLDEGFKQVSASLAYNVGPSLDLSVRGYWRDSQVSDRRWAVSPRLSWNIASTGRLSASIDTEVTLANDEIYGFVKLRFHQFGGGRRHWSVQGSAGMAASDDRNEGTGYDDGVRPVASGQVQWHDADLLADELRLTAGGELDRQKTAVGFGEAYYEGPAGLLRGEARATRTPGGGFRPSFTGSAATTLAIDADGFSLGGANASEAVVVAWVDGPSRRARFDVLVNGQTAATLEGTGRVVLPLPAYTTYRVALRPTGAAGVDVDGAEREVTLYPGNVTTLRWNARPVIAVYGRALAPDGTPLRGARIDGVGEPSFTDGDGYFQLDVRDGDVITVRTHGGRSCALDLTGAVPADMEAANYVNLGARTCQ
jgi:hypothetical protein